MRVEIFYMRNNVRTKNACTKKYINEKMRDENFYKGKKCTTKKYATEKYPY